MKSINRKERKVIAKNAKVGEIHFFAHFAKNFALSAVKINLLYSG
jgi:hypothetical protein